MLKGLIPTGGRGTRLRPFTFSTNKHLIPIANKPLVLYPVEALVEAGIKDIGIVTNETRPEIERLLGTGRQWGVRFTYIDQPHPGGLAHVIEVSQGYLRGSKFVYHLGDNLFTDGIKGPLEHFIRTEANALAPYLHHKNNRRLGVPYFNKKGALVKYLEKPANPPHDLAVPGLYFFDHNVFKCFSGRDRIRPSKRGEFEISSVYQWLIDHGYSVETCQVKGWWRDPGQLSDIIEANRLVMDRKSLFQVETAKIRNSKLIGKIGIGRKSKITNSVIHGPVLIGDGVEVTDSYIGPYTSVYHNCVIRGSKLANSVVMEQTTIENVKKKIDQSFIGKEVKISGRLKNHHLIISDLSEVHL
jgi:glucose-1-phosphate thymidylyltransferase